MGNWACIINFILKDHALWMYTGGVTFLERTDDYESKYPPKVRNAAVMHVCRNG